LVCAVLAIPIAHFGSAAFYSQWGTCIYGDDVLCMSSTTHMHAHADAQIHTMSCTPRCQLTCIARAVCRTSTPECKPTCLHSSLTARACFCFSFAHILGVRTWELHVQLQAQVESKLSFASHARIPLPPVRLGAIEV
jgi:hypothetical protein